MLTYSYISERDIDLILVEELNCAPNFQKWFLNKIKKSLGKTEWSGIRSMEAFHSTSRGNSSSGETDVELHVIDKSDKKIILLLENKIDAGFQASQPTRYKTEVENILKNGSAEYCYSVLLAPKDYLTTVEGVSLFDIVVSYDEIINYFISRSKTLSKSSRELSDRYNYRKDIFVQAVGKQRRGYVPEADEAVTAFWAEYYEYANKHAPSLNMDLPGPKPSQSDFINFNRAIQRIYPLPRCTIKHKLNHALVDLEIDGWGKYIQDVSPKLEKSLDTDMRIRKAAKSLAITIDVKAITVSSPFKEQVDLVALGLNASLRMQEWYRIRKNELIKSYNSLSDKTQ